MAAQSPTATEHREDRTGKPQLLVVDLEKSQTEKQVKRLRKGRGKLLVRVEKIVDELIEAGTVPKNAQPVVIIVRERPALPWPFK